MSSEVPWIVTSSRHCTSPGGAPACSAARARTSVVAAAQRRPRGCGAHTMAFPDLSAERVLNITVEVGVGDRYQRRHHPHRLADRRDLRGLVAP